jgi:hypothetical protein
VQIVKKDGISRHFGFVTFSDELSVEKALLVQHDIGGRMVELKRAVPKEEMAAAAGSGGYGGGGFGGGGFGGGYGGGALGLSPLFILYRRRGGEGRGGDASGAIFWRGGAAACRVVQLAGMPWLGAGRCAWHAAGHAAACCREQRAGRGKNEGRLRCLPARLLPQPCALQLR